MDIRLYNSLSKTKEVFSPINPDLVGVYSCGPTVYNTQTIGNFRAFIFADVLVRTLRFNGLKVNWIMNITDVGHLTDDADAGEDKMEKRAREENLDAREIAREITDQFLLDMDRFGINRPDKLPKATEHIAEQIKIVQALEEKGFTYVIDDGVYFDTAKLQDYGRLAGQKVEDKEGGARVELNSQKKNVTDFALWKFSPKDEQRQMEWESPWGVGFPGWHVECTAMSTKYLGNLYDIHTGGEDHKMVHHPNEMAQSQGALESIEANIWMHNAFLQVDGGKMGKSLGNGYTADDILGKGFEPIAFRYLTLTADYRRPLNFTWTSLEAANNAFKKLQTTVRKWDTPSTSVKKYEDRFLEHLNNDLDTPGAIALMWELVNNEGIATAERGATLLKFDEVLGLGLVDAVGRPVEVPAEVQILLDQRKDARAVQDWDSSDRLRDEIKAKGYIVDDGPGGQMISEL